MTNNFLNEDDSKKKNIDLNLFDNNNFKGLSKINKFNNGSINQNNKINIINDFIPNQKNTLEVSEKKDKYLSNLKSYSNNENIISKNKGK